MGFYMDSRAIHHGCNEFPMGYFMGIPTAAPIVCVMVYSDSMVYPMVYAMTYVMMHPMGWTMG